ncbi:hypothetical protein V2J09_017140 [Rumex salicifolius]
MSREREELEEIGKRIKREIDASPSCNNNKNINSSANTVMRRAAVGGVLNTVTPCAACKLLRRRCAEECPFSPYFSPHEPQKFAAVHKVFGASNVSKMLLEVNENQRADAANSLVYEANVRLRDPIYGCMGAISSLQRQIQTLQSQLNAVRAEIFKFKFSSVNPNSVISTPGVHHAPATPPLVSVADAAASSTSSAAATASNNMYTQPPSSTTAGGGFSSISSDSVAYFD